jgi:hypothetical protein
MTLSADPTREHELLSHAAKGKNRNARPYFDFALGAAESVSVLHASLIISSLKARDEGDEDLADMLAAEAPKIEDALYQTALVVVREIQATAAYIRTGHVSETTGEWRDTRPGITGPTSSSTPRMKVVLTCMHTSPCTTGFSSTPRRRGRC